MLLCDTAKEDSEQIDVLVIKDEADMTLEQDDLTGDQF